MNSEAISPARALVLFMALVAIGSGVWMLHRFSGGEPLRTPGLVRQPDEHVGGVVSGPDGPLGGASVGWQAVGDAVVTDSDGAFSLPRLPRANRITASASGHYITATTVDREPVQLSLTPLPAEDCQAYEWVDPSPASGSRHRCSDCHERIHAEWQRSAHARSTANPRLRDLIEGTDAEGNADVGWGLRRDHPHGVTVCNSCHAPTLEPGDPHWDSPAAARGVAALGVHCDFCHKVQDVDTTKVGLTHGRYGMRLLRPTGNRQIIFGPHADATREDNAFAPVYRRSEYCAACHEGTVFGIKVYGTYGEWRDSPAARRGQQCQDCHMAAAADITNMATGHGGVPRDPATLSDHSLAGPATQRYRDALKVMLQTESSPEGLVAIITVDASDVGHAVPTGFIDRHVLLLVDAEDALGNSVPVVNGPRIPDFAGDSVGGRAGELYARVLVDSAGTMPAPFWAAVDCTMDTRIVPDRPHTARITFAGAASRLRIRLLHRHFWESVRVSKRWPDDTTVVLDRIWRISGGNPAISAARRPVAVGPDSP